MFDKFIRLIQSREDNAIMDIYNDIANYWKATDNFLLAHQRYLQDLNYRFKLNFDEEFIVKFPTMILVPLVGMGLTQSNAKYIFSQFVFYHIFGGQKPNRLRHSDDYINDKIDKIEDLLIPSETSWGGFKLILSKHKYSPLI